MNAMSPIAVNDDISAAVRETAMLADVTISVWSAEKSDADLMNQVKADAGAVGNVGRVVKNMLAGADGLLKDAKSAYTAVRAAHYALTLPWVADPHAERQRGPRLLPNRLFHRYMDEISTRKRAALVSLDTFIADYPDAVVRARANLARLADVAYPSPDEVRQSFRVAFDFEPIPATTQFRGLPDGVLTKLSMGLERKQAMMVASAQAAMWEAVRDRVTHVVDRLSDPETKFKASTVENLRELIVLLPGWNVAQDGRVAEVVRDIDRMIAGVTADKLRSDIRVRADVADQARGLSDKLNQWGL